MILNSAISRDIASVTAACVFHGALLASNPSVQWGLAGDEQSDAVAVEFVQAPPASPLLAPVPPSGNGAEGMPSYGEGAFESEQLKAGAPEAPSAEEKAQEERRRTLARQYREKIERLLKAQSRRQEKVRKGNDLQARLQQGERAEQMRKKALELQAVRQKQAEFRARRRQRQVELTEALASMPNPDEELYDAPNAIVPGYVKGNSEAVPAEVRQTPAPADLADPVFDEDGRQGAEDRNVRPAGGGPASDAGGVGWSLEGPIGNRRMVSRRLPTCPDWVSERSLDLAVQIKFQVLPDGTIRRGRVIKKTSGFPDLDRRAMDAINEWKFEPIAGEAVKDAPETWGVVTFKFTAG